MVFLWFSVALPGWLLPSMPGAGNIPRSPCAVAVPHPLAGRSPGKRPDAMEKNDGNIWKNHRKMVF